MWISCIFWWPFVATYFPLPPKRATCPKTVNPLSVEICQVVSNSWTKIIPNKFVNLSAWSLRQIPWRFWDHQTPLRAPKKRLQAWVQWRLDNWTCDRVTVRVCLCFLRLCFFFGGGEKRQKDTNGRFGTWLNLFRFVVLDVLVFGLFSVTDVCWNPVVDRYLLDFMTVYRHFRRITEISTGWAQEPVIGSWFQLGVKEPQWKPVYFRPFI